MANRDLMPWRAGAGLTPFGGRDPFDLFRREMDRLFDDFFAPLEARSRAAAPPAPALAGLWPRLEVEETDEAYAVSAELPGVDPDDLRVDLKDNVLTLSGEKRSERNEEDGGRRYSERSFGRFERTIPLTAEVDADKVAASFAHGVLTITLPKNAKARDTTRRIDVKLSAPAKPTAKSPASGNGKTKVSAKAPTKARPAAPRKAAPPKPSPGPATP